MKAKESDFDFTVEEITEAADTWAVFPQFVGEACGGTGKREKFGCGKTANVLLGARWFCVCGRYNAQSFSGGPPLHDNPDLGPTAATIREGIAKSEKWQRLTGGES